MKSSILKVKELRQVPRQIRNRSEPILQSPTGPCIPFSVWQLLLEGEHLVGLDPPPEMPSFIQPTSISCSNGPIVDAAAAYCAQAFGLPGPVLSTSHCLISFPLLQTREAEQLIILIKDLLGLVHKARHRHLSSRFQKRHFISPLVSVAPPSLGPRSFHLPFLEQDQVSSLTECSRRQRLELSLGRGEEREALYLLGAGKTHKTWCPGEVRRCRRSSICLPGWPCRGPG